MKELTLLKAMRAYCLNCAESPKDVKNCPMADCPLYLFRFGKNPNIKREYTEEERKSLVSRLSKKSP